MDQTVYDHASIPATVKKTFNLMNFLSKRDATANTFDACLTLANPREDTPESLSPLLGAVASAAEDAFAAVRSAHQDDLLAVARQLDVAGQPSPEGSPEAVILHVARYLGS